MVRKIPISQRLILGYIIIITISMTTCYMAILEIRHIWSDTKNLYERPYMVSNLLRDVNINALNMRRYMLDMTLLKGTKAIDDLEDAINSEEMQAFDNFNKISELYDGNKSDIVQSIETFRNWKPLRDDVIATIRSGNIDKSFDMMVTRNRDYVNNMFFQMQKFIDFTSHGAKSFYLSAQRTKQKIMNLFVILVFLSLGISIFLAFVITRSIAKPLRSILNRIHEIARGNLNNKKLETLPDEIGEIGLSLNIMQHNLLQKANVAEQIAKGDFSVHINPSGENDIVAGSINMIARNFEIVVHEAQKIANGDFESKIEGFESSHTLMAVINQMLDSLKEVVSKAREVAKGNYSGQIVPKSKSDKLAYALNQMTESLRLATEHNIRQDRLKSAKNELTDSLQGEHSLDEIANIIITYIAKYTQAQVGTIYFHNEDQKGYQLMGSYAFSFRKDTKTFFREGESLVGQAALEKEIMIFRDLPDDYIQISSGIGNTIPKNLMIIPFTHENKTVGVCELGSVENFSDESCEFVNMIRERVALSVISALNYIKVAKLLEVTTTQAEELQVQQEELLQANEELESQTVALMKSEESLQSQKEELKVINEELAENSRRLEEHKAQLESKNQDLENSRLNLEKNAQELINANRYKTEFLANMSHELRTPLNSLLILAQNLVENKEKNLSPQQVESAQIIYNSGNDLCNLINDILDLSKIESGKMNISWSTLFLSKIENSIRNYFEHMIKEKRLDFKYLTSPDVPEKFTTDEQRLNQILRNFMSNAIKFTEKGSIIVRVFKPEADEDLSQIGLSPSQTIAFSVKDTGIGIPKEKQFEIFKAFHQVDGSISRNYGGTGLGLSITLELSNLLGGQIKVFSEPDNGSEFILYLPINPDRRKSMPGKYFPPQVEVPVSIPDQKVASINRKTDPVNSPLHDNRAAISPNDNSILIIEDDVNFARLLAKICKDKGISYLSTTLGEEGIELAREYLPKGIILDIKLPGIDGWEVLEHLKNSAKTRHIPVHVISSYEESIEAYTKGVFGYLTKPVTKDKLEQAFNELQAFTKRNVRELLIVEDNAIIRKSIKSLLAADDILITESTTAQQAIDAIGTYRFDCIVLDLGLPDMTGLEMLKILKDKNCKIPPIVIYTGRDLNAEEKYELQQYTGNIIVKDAKSEERLLDETSLFLHRVVDEMPERQRKLLINLYDKEENFKGKNILIVDDDMRNVFAITQLLEASHMKVLMAQNGKKALEVLQNNRDVDLILMDIMMPVMDGYETIQHIREDNHFKKIPIIALTAKAMKEDRDKSLAAGANDYLSKPLDTRKLFNLMRIWLYK